jgi:hypothetical protein
MRPFTRPRPLVSLALAAVPGLALGAAFWAPSYAAGRGWFPVPLDDVYIHFDFARSLATGHPFEWIPGQGYSSGETSPLYAVLLAVGWLLGLHERLIGFWAAFLAIVSLAVLVRSTHRLVQPCPWWLAGPLAALPLSLGIVDWALFSGMEVAATAGALGCALVALSRARSPSRGGPTRESLQWRLGLWGAALVLLRPESAVLVFVFAIFAARGAGARSGLAAVTRAALPGALATAAVLVVNHLATGDARSAGAQLKLLSSNPFFSDVDRARVFVENLLTFAVRVLRLELSSERAGALLVPALALVGLFSRTRRAVAGACLAGAVAWIALVSWNGNSPYHNFRYYAPALLLLLVGAALGLAAIARRTRLAASGLAALAFALAAPRIPEQVKHFGQSVANVRDQQVEVGLRLAAVTAPSARILLGDAGAIPFVSGRSAIDALGLGGFHRMPFARAAVHGEAATVELLERLAPEERPTHLALYPNWFGVITKRFGDELDRVTITHNIICGGPTKGIYRADWSALDKPHPPGPEVVDELDVADVISETEHAYVSPAPRGGWTTLEILTDASGAGRFDAGRIVPEGSRETFVARRGGRVTLIMRVDPHAGIIRATTRSGAVELALDPAREGAWRTARAEMDVLAGESITLEAARGWYRDYHVWLVDQLRSSGD